MSKVQQCGKGRRPASLWPRTSALGGSVVAVALMLLAVAVPARADAGESLGLEGGELFGHGARVQVRVSYECPVGQTAGVGIFLTQNEPGHAAYGGAGSGPLSCTGETDEVVLTVPAGSGHFVPGCAAATVSLFTSGSGSPDNLKQRSGDLRLERR